MINYDILASAKSYYAKEGFRYIEVPWLVSEEISDITRPPFALQYEVSKGDKHKAFIASGEQGFLYLAARGNIADGMYQTITPCIRNDNFDELHTKYFMKNELIFINPPNPDAALDLVMSEAETFFRAMTRERQWEDIHKVKNGDGWDIEYQGIELGSYGIRECALCTWVYGTGVAEPRFSRVFKK
jgi:hypothetical protein